MATKKTTTKSDGSTELTYQELRAELEALILKLQDPDVDVDAAADMYAQALTLIKQLEKHLETAENRVKKVQAEFGA